MRTKVTYIYFMLLVAACGCNHHHLYYSSSESVEVTINIDWSQSGITDPNGVTAIAYWDSGELYRQFSPFSSTSQITLELPEGVFDIILYNNTNSEYEYINFEATDNFSTAIASSVSKSSVRTLDGDDVGKDVVNDPEIFASAVLQDVEITGAMVEYYYSQPEQYYGSSESTYSVSMLRRTVQVLIYVEIDDIRYAGAAPYTLFKHLAGGFLLGQEVADSREVIQEFVLNSVVYDDDTKYDGTIMKEFTSFGQVSDPDAEYIVDIDFQLLDGDWKRYIFDVSDQIDIEYNSEGVPYIDIYLSLTLPYAEGLSTGELEGGFTPEVGPWDDVNATLPM